MGEQTWNSWVGCLPLVYEFWFARICNSFIFPSFRGSCLRALGKSTPWFSAEGTLMSEGSWQCASLALCCLTQVRALQTPRSVREERACSGFLWLSREDGFRSQYAWPFQVVFFSSGLCSPAYWINSERVLNLHLKKNIYVQMWNESEHHLCEEDLSSS